MRIVAEGCNQKLRAGLRPVDGIRNAFDETPPDDFRVFAAAQPVSAISVEVFFAASEDAAFVEREPYVVVDGGVTHAKAGKTAGPAGHAYGHTDVRIK